MFPPATELQLAPWNETRDLIGGDCPCGSYITSWTWSTINATFPMDEEPLDTTPVDGLQATCTNSTYSLVSGTPATQPD